MRLWFGTVNHFVRFLPVITVKCKDTKFYGLPMNDWDLYVSGEISGCVGAMLK